MIGRAIIAFTLGQRYVDQRLAFVVHYYAAVYIQQLLQLAKTFGLECMPRLAWQEELDFITITSVTV